jgi:hypothetical protein
VLREFFGIARGDSAIYLAVSVLVLAGASLFAARRQQLSLETRLADFNNVALLFLFLLSPAYPWYVLMVVPFVALRGGAPNWLLSIGAFLLQDEVTWDSYVPLLTRQTILYGAFLAACAYVMWRRWGRRSAQEARHELAGA